MGKGQRVVQVVERLSAEIDRCVAPVLERVPPKRVALLDIPDHANVGDQAIFLGEMAFLKRALPKAKILPASTRTFTTATEKLVESVDLIFLHGGGNFGDIWLNHHNHRLDIIRKFKTKPIIQFPQSIHFGSQKRLSETQDAIAKCKDFTLFVRDIRSLEFATKHFSCESLLAPDMAFAIGSLEAPKSAFDYSCLMRTDKEVKVSHASSLSKLLYDENLTYVTHDWLDESPVARRAHSVLRLLARTSTTSYLAGQFGLPAFTAYARARLRVGIERLGAGRSVVTDRLHGMIISTLLGRPRYIFDSMDGKIHNFHRTWLTDDTTAFLCTDLNELRELVRR